MKILHLKLRKKWFDMILSGEKKEEYREIKPYWAKRLFFFKDKTYFNDMEEVYGVCDSLKNGQMKLNKDAKQADYTHICFENGYNKNSPSFVIELGNILIGKGHSAWGAPDENVFILQLGNIISTNQNQTT